MRTIEAENEGAPWPAGPFGVYWLAFLLTGHRERSFDLALEAVDLHDDANPFFSGWMAAWSRRVVIAKALSAIRDELAASARRIASKRVPKVAVAAGDRTLNSQPTKLQLERALLALDTFPRCALLLSVFEGVSVEDSAVLLDADPKLVLKGRTAGLWELTRNLIGMQPGTSSGYPGHVIESEI